MYKNGHSSEPILRPCGDHCIVLDKGKVLSCGRFESTDSSLFPTVMKAEGTRTSYNAGKITDQRSTNENMNSGIENIHEEKRSTGIVEWPTWAAYGKAAGSFGICSLSCHLVLIGVSQRLHDQMLRSVLRSKIDFFDTTPLGRILNRFSADVGISDEILPLTIYDFLVGFFIVVGGVVTASIVLPFILVALPPLVWYFMVLRLTFVKTTRELKRLEGIAWSPIFAMMSESLQGMSTVRANNYSEYFRTRLEELHDAHTRAYFAFVASSCWFATRMDILFVVVGDSKHPCSHLP
jgi:ABC-type multidrug transport system fused ATPase/permease subunit